MNSSSPTGKPFDTPVLFLAYNRPELTERVFSAIRKRKPKKLFISADGPSENKPNDVEKCKQVRAILSNVDWDCDIKYLFREKNIGAGLAVSQSISWMFDHVSEGIILEDDCLPSDTFFDFMAFALDKFRENNSIMHINGTNFLRNRKFNFTGTFYYSKLAHPWGWATWKRAWKHFDFDMSNLAEFKQLEKIKNLTSKPEHQNYYLNLFELTTKGRFDSWDFQWVYTILNLNCNVITPVKNMVTNIGFGAQATHTTYLRTRIGGMKRNEIHEFRPPISENTHRKADDFSISMNLLEGKYSLLERIIYRIKGII